MPTLIDTTQEIMDKLKREGKLTIISKEKSQEINDRINEKMKIARRECYIKQAESRRKSNEIYLTIPTSY